MITREKLEEFLDDDSKNPYQEKDIDYEIKALILLREKIPHDVCPGIIIAAEHDKIYLCNVDEAILYIDEDDAMVLADCNVCIDHDYDTLYMFI